MFGRTTKCLVALLFAVATLTAVNSATPASAAIVNNQKFVIPAYYYPNFIDPFVAHPSAPYGVAGHPEYDYWYRACSGLESVGGGTMVMNPQGADRTTSANFDYQTNLMFCHKDNNGVSKSNRVIAYVDTAYGTRLLSDVQDDIDNMYSFYYGFTVSAVPEHGIDGIFLDNLYNKATNVLNPVAATAYYSSIYSYIKAKDASAVVVGNPGVPDTTDWQISTPVVDELNVFEGNPSTYMAYSPPSWVMSAASNQIWNLVYSATTTNERSLALGRSRTVNAGHIFVTDGDGLWTSLPDDTYLQAEFNTAKTTVAVQVDPTLVFTVAAHGGACNGVSQTAGVVASGTAVGLGHVGSSSNVVGAQDLSVTTNASSGFSVYARTSGGMDRQGGGSTIDAVSGSNASPSSFPAAGNEAFGYTLSDSTLAGGTADRFTNPTSWAAFSGSNQPVLDGNTPGSVITGCIAFQLGISGSTPAGIYQATAIYTAIPTF